MNARALLAAIALTVAAAACTPNGVGVAAGGGGGGGVTHVVDVNLTLNQPATTPYGQSGGMKPPVLDVAVGDRVVFHNSDGFAHTSTSIKGAAAFPAAEPFGISALNQSGTTLSGGWSSGAMQAGSSSQPVLVDKPGTYLYGCFFHYGAPMRGAIVAR